MNSAAEADKFQFLKGAIKSGEIVSIDMKGEAYFNSLKVRLKGRAFYPGIALPYTFQFLKGAIKSNSMHGKY